MEGGTWCFDGLYLGFHDLLVGENLVRNKVDWKTSKTAIKFLLGLAFLTFLSVQSNSFVRKVRGYFLVLCISLTWNLVS